MRTRGQGFSLSSSLKFRFQRKTKNYETNRLLRKPSYGVNVCSMGLLVMARSVAARSSAHWPSCWLQAV